jgi:hypothetical protein
MGNNIQYPAIALGPYGGFRTRPVRGRQGRGGDVGTWVVGARAGLDFVAPVEWHESFAILTQRRAPMLENSPRQRNDADGSDSTRNPQQQQQQRNVMIEDISLKTIPNTREFANDTLMDVLFFMSPEHHQIIIDVVTHEMNLGT